MTSARTEAWLNLREDDFTIAARNLGAEEFRRIKELVSRWGICRLRFINMDGSEQVLWDLAREFGRPSPAQNDSVGALKTIRPVPTGIRNSGDTSKDIGLHVDGTQHDKQPPVLFFQYVREPKLGGRSVFVDVARALGDLDEADRNQLLLALSRSDAGTFSKRGLTYTGPILWVTPWDTVGIRLAAAGERMEEGKKHAPTLIVNPACVAEFDRLCEVLNDEKRQLVFQVLEGDVVIFDNWRVLHAREEIFGQPVREHRRMWIEEMLPARHRDCTLGIGGIPFAVRAQMAGMSAAATPVPTAPASTGNAMSTGTAVPTLEASSGSPDEQESALLVALRHLADDTGVIRTTELEIRSHLKLDARSMDIQAVMTRLKAKNTFRSPIYLESGGATNAVVVVVS